MADEASAVYWNPAGIGTLNQGRFDIIYGSRQEDHKDALHNLHELVEEGLIDATSGSSETTLAKRSRLLKRLADLNNQIRDIQEDIQKSEDPKTKEANIEQRIKELLEAKKKFQWD